MTRGAIGRSTARAVSGTSLPWMGGLVACAALLALVIWPGLSCFIGDDDDTWIGWGSRPWSEVLSTATPYETHRPAFAVLMAAEQRLFGPWYAGYRLVGYAAHVMAVILLFLLLRDTLDDRRAALAALLFLVAPVHHETLFWIAGRADLLSGSFVLAALLCLDRAIRSDRPGPRSALGAAAVLLSMVAVLFKETGLVVVPLLLGWALLHSRGARRIRDAALAVAVVAPALMLLPLSLAGSAGPSRLGNAVRVLPARIAWILPGLGTLVWPYSVDELRVQVHRYLGAGAKWWMLAFAAGLVVIFVLGRRVLAGTPQARSGLLLLGVGLLPFLMLSQHRLLYLAPAGLAVLVLVLPRRRWAAALAVLLIAAHLVGLRRQSLLWREATEVGRRAARVLSAVPETEILLVDFPLDVGGVLGSAGGVLRARRGKTIEFLAPLRVPRAAGWASSRIDRVGEDLVVRRPVAYGDHLNYPCDLSRMTRSLARVRVEHCRGDASEAVAVAVRELEGIGLYRYREGEFLPVVFARE